MNNRWSNWIAFNTIFIRECRRFIRIWPQTILPPAISMSLYFIIFGRIIGPRIGTMAGYNYMAYVLPGLVMMAVITNSYTNVAFSFFSSKFQKSIEELLVSPVPNWIILVGYSMGGIIRGLLTGLIVIIFGLFFVKLQLHSLLITVLAIFMTATLFSLAGFINALYAKTFDDVSIIPTFVLTPLTYLGGVFYSISILPPFWQKLSLLNPVLYQVSAFRFGIIGVSDSLKMGVAFTVMTLGIIILATYSLFLLKKGKGLRS